MLNINEKYAFLDKKWFKIAVSTSLRGRELKYHRSGWILAGDYSGKIAESDEWKAERNLCKKRNLYKNSRFFCGREYMPVTGQNPVPG